jgi:hypothetical protein
MNSTIQLHIPRQTVQERLVTLLDDLSPEGLTVAEQFVRFLREYAKQGQAQFTFQRPTGFPSDTFVYPTVCLPASSLNAWLNLIPVGYAGDALTDTEAVYDEV